MYTGNGNRIMSINLFYILFNIYLKYITNTRIVKIQ